jgi:hypothetical protein
MTDDPGLAAHPRRVLRGPAAPDYLIFSCRGFRELLSGAHALLRDPTTTLTGARYVFCAKFG